MTPQAEPTNKRKNDDDRAARSKRYKFDESISILEQARKYEIVTAHMPLDALETRWSLGTDYRIENRRINLVHKQRLLDTFMNNGAHRTDPKNYAIVKTSKRLTDKMFKYLRATNDGEIQPFFDWQRVNGSCKVEVLNGQHRLAAWQDFIRKNSEKKADRSWTCVLLDKNRLPPELDLKLRFNRPETAMEDTPGDIWMQLVAAVSSLSSKLQSQANTELAKEIKDVLQLGSEDKVQHRLVTIWKNERWRKKATEWCETTIGRETLNFSKWDTMISLRIDEFWFHMFDHVKATLKRLPGDGTMDVGLSDWNKLATHISTGRERLESVQELFYPASTLGDEPGSTTLRRRDFLAAYNDDLYLTAYKYIQGNSDLHFWDFQKVLKVANGDLQQLRRVMEHVVTWLNANPTLIGDKRVNDKPPLRIDLVPGLRQLGAAEESRFRKGLEMPAPKNHLDATESSQERASFLLQQEVIEYVLENMKDFLSKKASPWLKLSRNGPNEASYSDRFRVEPWTWLLRIVNRYAKKEVRPEWHATVREPLNSRRIARDVSHTICSQLEIAGYSRLKEKFASQALQGELADWLSERFQDELQDDAATTSRAQRRTDCNVIGDPYDVPEDTDSQVLAVSEVDESSDGAPVSGPAAASPAVSGPGAASPDFAPPSVSSAASPAASASFESASPSASPAASPAAFASPGSAPPSASPVESPAASASPESSSFVSARAFAPTRHNLAVSPELRGRSTLSSASKYGRELKRGPNNSGKATTRMRDKVQERQYNTHANGLIKPSYRPKNPLVYEPRRSVESPVPAKIPGKTGRPARRARKEGWRPGTQAAGKEGEVTVVGRKSAPTLEWGYSKRDKGFNAERVREGF